MGREKVFAGAREGDQNPFFSGGRNPCAGVRDGEREREGPTKRAIGIKGERERERPCLIKCDGHHSAAPFS
jgi:hypothetical protein